MNFFRLSFGINPPFHVLVDPEFLATSLARKLFVKTSVPECLGGKATLIVTRCVTHFLRSNGDKYAGAAAMAKRLQHAPCAHDEGTTMSPDSCLFNLLQQSSEETGTKYCLATQSTQLRNKARDIAGVPIIYINNTMLCLEPPSRTSQKHAQLLSLQHRKPKEAEKRWLERQQNNTNDNNNNETEGNNNGEDGGEKQTERRSRKRKAKGPNPLSVKKKQPKKRKLDAEAGSSSSSSASTADGGEQQKKKRRRKRKRHSATPKKEPSEA
ncbi:Small subunit processome component [Balamuthia mandrillaris]